MAPAIGSPGAGLAGVTRHHCKSGVGTPVTAAVSTTVLPGENATDCGCNENVGATGAASTLSTAAARFHGIGYKWPVDLNPITFSNYGIERFELAVDADFIFGEINFRMLHKQTTFVDGFFYRAADFNIEIDDNRLLRKRITKLDVCPITLNHKGTPHADETIQQNYLQFLQTQGR